MKSGRVCGRGRAVSPDEGIERKVVYLLTLQLVVQGHLQVEPIE